MARVLAMAIGVMANPSQKGGYARGKKEGTWIYYYTTGKRCQEVNYAGDSAISYTCYDEKENVQKDNCIYEKEANFPGGEKKWIQYLLNKLSAVRLPDDVYNGNIFGKVSIQFTIDIDGVLEATVRFVS